MDNRMGTDWGRGRGRKGGGWQVGGAGAKLGRLQLNNNKKRRWAALKDVSSEEPARETEAKWESPGVRAHGGCMSMCMKSCDNERKECWGVRLNKETGHTSYCQKLIFLYTEKITLQLGSTVILFYSSNDFVLKVIRCFGLKCKCVSC